MRTISVCLLSGTVILLTGCGGGLPKTVKVTGRVTFDGQPPPAEGCVYFLHVEAADGFSVHPATGIFGKDGAYSAKTFEPGDGLSPGTYVMHVECWETPPNLEGKPTKSYVPAKYQSAQTSGFELKITPDMRAQEVDLNIVTK